MPHYRNLTIASTDSEELTKYRYNIGKRNVVIISENNEKQLINKEDIAFQIGSKYKNGKIYPNLVITPGMIADYIRSGAVNSPSNYFDSCPHVGQRSLTWSPFDSEIHEKQNYWYACEKCVQSNADDI